jgi:hypothetical protein
MHVQSSEQFSGAGERMVSAATTTVRHSFISTQFDGYATPTCESRCDMYTGERLKHNVQMQFESRQLSE